MSDSHSEAEGGGNAPKAGCQPPLKTKKKKKKKNTAGGDNAPNSGATRNKSEEGEEKKSLLPWPSNTRGKDSGRLLTGVLYNNG